MKKGDYISSMACLLNMIIYGIAVAAALWEHGQPVFTIGVLCAIVVAVAMARFTRGLNSTIRYILTMLFPVLGAAWLIYRLMAHDPADKFIVEALAVAGISFFFNPRPKEQGYLD